MKERVAKVYTYIIMYRDIEVFTYNFETEKIVLKDEELLPVVFRNKTLSVSFVEKWLNTRFGNLHRMNMSKVYLARGIGCDRHRLILDSNGLSITDNYWIAVNEVSTCWCNIIGCLDKNKDLNKLALTGKVIKIMTCYMVKPQFSQ